MNTLHRRVIFKPVTEAYEAARAEAGLAPLGRSFLDTLVSPFLYLQGTVPSFEYPRSDLPPQLRFVGPLLPPPVSRFTPPSWWPELSSGRPVVLVTQGTVADDPRLVIAPTLEALAEEDVLVVATADRARSARCRTTPGSALRAVRRAAPARLRAGHQRRLRRAPAGARARCPDRGRGRDRGQARDRRAGRVVGRRPAHPGAMPGPRRTCATPSRRVLREPAFRTRAQAIAAEMATYDAPVLAADPLERLARPQPLAAGQRSASR